MDIVIREYFLFCFVLSKLYGLLVGKSIRTAGLRASRHSLTPAEPVRGMSCVSVFDDRHLNNPLAVSVAHCSPTSSIISQISAASVFCVRQWANNCANIHYIGRERHAPIFRGQHMDGLHWINLNIHYAEGDFRGRSFKLFCRAENPAHHLIRDLYIYVTLETTSTVSCGFCKCVKSIPQVYLTQTLNDDASLSNTNACQMLPLASFLALCENVSFRTTIFALRPAAEVVFNIVFVCLCRVDGVMHCLDRTLTCRCSG